jgi:hypothetical protein
MADRRAHQPTHRRRPLGGANRRGPSRIHPDTPAKRTGFLCPKSVANDAVLRDLPGCAKTVTTGERIELDP